MGASLVAARLAIPIPLEFKVGQPRDVLVLVEVCGLNFLAVSEGKLQILLFSFLFFVLANARPQSRHLLRRELRQIEEGLRLDLRLDDRHVAYLLDELRRRGEAHRRTVELQCVTVLDVKAFGHDVFQCAVVPV